MSAYIDIAAEDDDNDAPQSDAVVNAPARPKKKPFRMTAKNFFLTYPRYNEGYGHEEGLDGFIAAFCKKFMPTKWLICQEAHKHERGLHYHVLAMFAHKKNIKSKNHWDLEDHHGHYKTVHDLEGLILYIKKDGDWKGNMDEFIIDAVRPGMRRKVYDDLRWSKQYRLRESMTPISWPLRIRNIHGFEWLMSAPTAVPKKRNWWIVTAANTGKSTWIENTIRMGKALRINEKCKYPYEDYNGEQLIIMDDHYPTFNELADVLNVYQGPKKVFGDTRYTSVYWEINQVRNVIVLVNKTIDDMYEGNAAIIDAVHARFITITDPKFY